MIIIGTFLAAVLLGAIILIVLDNLFYITDNALLFFVLYLLTTFLISILTVPCLGYNI